MGIAWTVSEIIEHLFKLLFSWLRSAWPSMKVKVNIINTWCILMSEAVIMHSLMMKNSFWGITCEGHTHTHTPLLPLYLKLFQSRKQLWKQKRQGPICGFVAFYTHFWNCFSACDLLPQNGLLGPDTSCRQTSEGLSLCPPLDSHNTTDLNFSLLRCGLDWKSEIVSN